MNRQVYDTIYDAYSIMLIAYDSDLRFSQGHTCMHQGLHKILRSWSLRESIHPPNPPKFVMFDSLSN